MCSAKCLTSSLVLPKATSEYVPVGTPVACSRAYILDVLEERVPENLEGELYVSGPLVADGYLGGEADENKSYPFVQNPFANEAPKWCVVDHNTLIPQLVVLEC